MANCSRLSGQNDPSFEAVGDAGPSPRIRAWVAFFEELGDWLIDARRRWREGDPPTPRGAQRLLALTPVAFVLVVALQHLLGI
ncbi:MAG TPA: hypothetical protein VFW38_09380 [Solirubrobacteraceae bacterium]|nr:hypothetical protein [Solirubrobacteraceae bacterium]